MLRSLRPSRSLLAIGIVLALPAAAQAQKLPGQLPQSASSLELKWQPVIDFDTDSCYNIAAIGPDGAIAQGRPLNGLDVGDCRGAARLRGANVYSRARCNTGYCFILYSYYFEKDPATLPIGHVHDWEHVGVWTTADGNTAVSVAASAHGDYDVRAAGRIVWQETHPRIVYHSDGILTHAFRFAKTDGDDEPPENELGTWQMAPLVGWNHWPGMTLRDRLAAHVFGDATFAQGDAQFVTNIDKARGPAAFDARREDPLPSVR